jgi:hypothetical protein
MSDTEYQWPAPQFVDHNDAIAIGILAERLRIAECEAATARDLLRKAERAAAHVATCGCMRCVPPF